MQVDVDDLLPLLERQVGEAAEAVLARGVDQDRDRAQGGVDVGERGVATEKRVPWPVREQRSSG